MNILVCLKLVSQQHFADSLSDSDDRLSGGQLDFNPTDLYALELALRIKDAHQGTTVTAVTMSSDAARTALYSVLARGADRAVLISDMRLAGSDTLATAKVLAAAAKHLEAQHLILCGRKSLDSETAHIAPQLAELLGLPIAANVLSFELKCDRVDFICAEDACTGEYFGSLPAVMSICNGTDMVRMPTVSGMRRSKNSKILELNADSLELDTNELGQEGSATRTICSAAMQFRRGKAIFAKNADVGTDKLLSLLREELANE